MQNLAYLWDQAGNLSNRQDLRQGLTESFTYDALDRLTNASGPGAQSLSVGYDALGNVTSRSDVGSYGYHATRKHAVVSAGSNSYTYDANGNMATRNGSTLTWTSDNLPASLSAGGYTASFNYAPDRRRWRQVSTYAGATETTIYVGGLLEKLTTSVRVHWKHRIPTPSGEVQVIRRSDGTNDVFYVTTDHLGSTEAVMDAAGAILARESFGAWGARRGSNWSSGTPPDWTGIANTTRRGFTGHEHLDNILLVHMNGRVYDPAIGRFLSADPYVNGIDASQSWNRYAYVTNNPLAYTDPSGYFQRGDSLRAWVRAIEPGRSWEFSWGTFEGRATERWTLTLNYNSLNFWLGVRDLLRGNVSTGVEGASGEGRGGGGSGDSNRDKPQGQQQLCLAGNALQRLSKDAFKVGLELERAGLATAAIGFAATGPNGAMPGIALAGLGGAVTVAGAAGQLAGGALQFSSDPTAGGQNMAAGLASLSTAGVFYFAAGAYLRPGSNYVAREHNQRVASGFGAAGASVDLLSALSSFFEPQTANCQSTGP